MNIIISEINITTKQIFLNKNMEISNASVSRKKKVISVN